MSSLFLEGNPQLQKSGTDAASELADLCFPSLIEATDALLAHVASTDQPA